MAVGAGLLASLIHTDPVQAGGGVHCGTCPPPGPVQLQTQIDRPLLLSHGGAQEVVVKIDLRAIPHVHGKRSPLNIAVVLDRSGSMAGKKLEQAKQAAAMLVDQLAPEDIFSLVAYETDVEVLVPATRVQDKRRLHRAIERIHSGGSTALYAGVECGARELEEFLSDRRINRVLLLSDGLANVGPSSNREIANLGRRIARDGIAVTTIGLGNDYNEDLMAALAEASDANYYFVQDVEKLDEVFASELGELQSIVARRIIVEVTVPEGVTAMEFMGRPERFEGRKGSISFSQLAGAQNRYVLLKCRVDPARVSEIDRIAEVELRYANELEKDAPTVVARTAAGVGVTSDAALAAKSEDKEVLVEAEIMMNALATERAIALADHGKYREAGDAVDSQIRHLSIVKQAAPQARQDEIQEEIDLLESNRAEFGDDGLTKEGRKVLQWNSYQRKNSKTSLKSATK